LQAKSAVDFAKTGKVSKRPVIEKKKNGRSNIDEYFSLAPRGPVMKKKAGRCKGGKLPIEEFSRKNSRQFLLGRNVEGERRRRRSSGENIHGQQSLGTQ